MVMDVANFNLFQINNRECLESIEKLVKLLVFRRDWPVVLHQRFLEAISFHELSSNLWFLLFDIFLNCFELLNAFFVFCVVTIMTNEILELFLDMSIILSLYLLLCQSLFLLFLQLFCEADDSFDRKLDFSLWFYRFKGCEFEASVVYLLANLIDLTDKLLTMSKIFLHFQPFIQKFIGFGQM